METEEKVVKLQLDDGTVVDLPLELLPFFRTLHSMVEDIGVGYLEVAIPVANISAEEFRWLMDLYRDLLLFRTLRPDIPEGDSIYVMNLLDNEDVSRRLGFILKRRLVAVLSLYNFLHFNDSRPAELFVQDVLFKRLMGDEDLGVKSLIALEDVPFWAPHKPVVEYVLQSLPYARRYREVLSFLRESAPNVTPVLLEELPRPTLSPIVCASAHTLVITPAGLFGCGLDNNGQLGVGTGQQSERVPFTRLAFPGELISFSSGSVHTMLITTQGLFACGWNIYGQLGLALTGGRYYDFVRVRLEGRPLSVSCGTSHTMVITTEGLFATGANVGGLLGLGQAAVVYAFTRVPFIVGRPLSVVCGERAIILVTTDGLFLKDKPSGQFERFVLSGVPLSMACGDYHKMVITTAGLFAHGENFNGQLGLGDNESRESFEKVEIRGNPLVVACGSTHTAVLTTEGLFLCGDNFLGQLGIGGGMPHESTHFLKPSLGSVPFFTACGSVHTMLLSKEGLLGCGDNSQSQLGYPVRGMSPTRFVSSPIPGLPLSPAKEEEEGPEKKKPRLGCRVCDVKGSVMRQEVAHTHRLFCSELCQKKYHYFDRLMRLPGGAGL
jgi:hypothetical protein